MRSLRYKIVYAIPIAFVLQNLSAAAFLFPVLGESSTTALIVGYVHVTRNLRGLSHRASAGLAWK